MKRDKGQLLGHAEDNDGIQEYDNRLPDWWLGLFGFTILWGVGYAFDYHYVSNRSQLGSYEAEMTAAKERWPQSTVAALSFDEATLGEGAQVFATTCASCHGAELAGGIGPSLVDTTWIHGGEAEQIRATITNGVPAKGMPAWGPILGPDKVGKVAAFVVTKAKAGAPAAPTPTTSVATASSDPGEQVYRENCVACHGPELQGLVGPNLVDAEWIHGNTLADIQKTITNGVPEKGMVSWGPILGPEKIEAVARFVHTQANGDATH